MAKGGKGEFTIQVITTTSEAADKVRQRALKLEARSVSTQPVKSNQFSSRCVFSKKAKLLELKEWIEKKFEDAGVMEVT